MEEYGYDVDIDYDMINDDFENIVMEMVGGYSGKQLFYL